MSRHPQHYRRLLCLALLALLVGALAPASSALADRGGSQKAHKPSTPTALTTQDLSVVSATTLANTLAGSGVTVSNVTYTGATAAAGTFGGGDGILGFGSGIVLSSGNIADVVGPNTEDDVTTDNGTPGDTDLSTLSGFATLDAAVLEFDFVTSADNVFFDYVFASDEYNEYVNSQFNDVFAFYINGTNCATVGGDPVSINSINNGNPSGDPTPSHPELYRNNDLDDGGGAIDTEMDGLTVVLTCAAAVTPGATHHLKIAIADASDQNLDSVVFLRANSLSGAPSTIALSPPSYTQCVGGSMTLVTTVTSGEGTPIAGTNVTFSVTEGPHAGQGQVVPTNAGGQASFNYTGTSAGADTVRASFVNAQGATITSAPSTITWQSEPCQPTAVTLGAMGTAGNAARGAVGAGLLLAVAAAGLLLWRRRRA